MIGRQIGWTLSLAAMMTGFAVWSFALGSWLWEFAPPRWPDDDWLWFLLPAGAAFGTAIWLRFRRRVWIHFVGPGALAALAGSIGWMLSHETPEGMQGLGVAIGKALAVGLAILAAGVGFASLCVAAAAVAILAWQERSRPRTKNGEGPKTFAADDR